MDEDIETEVEIEYVEISPAVKEDGGVLVKNFDTIKIKCLPGDLPPKYTVDISDLKTFDDVIKISDLDISTKVEVLEDLGSVLATVAPPRTEEELDALDEEVTEDVDAVEGIKDEEKEEGEEGAEGEAKDGEEKAAGEDGKKPAPNPSEASGSGDVKPEEKKE